MYTKIAAKKKWYFSLFLSIILLCIHRNTSVLRKLELSLSASLCVLYSIVVSDGKLKCFFIVSLNYCIFFKNAISSLLTAIKRLSLFLSFHIYLILRLIFAFEEVLFQTEIISSEPRIDKTAPQISSLTSN